MVECQLPKLDVAGSSPVSRSIFSITWKLPKFTRYSVYSVLTRKQAHEQPHENLIPALTELGGEPLTGIWL